MSSNSNSLPRKDSLILMLDAANRSSYNNLVGKNVEVLVVGGGGGGGMDMGGGGGAGEVICQFYNIASVSGVAVNIGAGGWGAPSAGGGYRGDGAGPQPTFHQFTISATSGSDTNFGNTIARGGGYGGSSYFGYTPNYGYGANALAGAGGGGASGYNDSNYNPRGGGSSVTGFAGGNSSGQYYSGGGGGAGGYGKISSNPANYATGGPGLRFIQMSPFYFGGGGGGAAYSINTGGDGGIGGGGGGAVGTTLGGAGLNDGQPGGGGNPGEWTNRPGGNAGANTGGGGGGGSHYNGNNQGGNGGSGIVIVRYPGPQAATGGTVTFNNGYTYHTFLSGSSFFTPYGTSSTWLDQSKYQNHFTGQGAFANEEFGSVTSFLGNDLGNGNKFYRSSFSANLKVSQGGNGFTVLVWAKSTGGTGAWRKLIGNGDGENYIDLYQNPSGYWAQECSSTLYVDGVQVSNGSYYMPSAGWHLYGATNINSGGLSNPTQALSIGNEPGTSNAYPWFGHIAVAMMYNAILSESEMKEIYNAQKSRFNI